MLTLGKTGLAPVFGFGSELWAPKTHSTRSGALGVQVWQAQAGYDAACETSGIP